MNGPMNIHPVNFLIISGVLQCFMVAAILFFRQSERTISNRLLACIILSISMHLGYLIFLDLDLDMLYPSILWVPYSFLLGIGPLIYYYTKSLVQPDFQWRNIHPMHFLPLFIEVGLQVAQIGYSIYSGVIYYNVPSDFWLSVVFYVGSSVSILYFLNRSLQLIQEREDLLLKQLSNLKKVTLQWLFNNITYFRIIWMLWVPFAIVFLLFFRFQWQNLFLLVVIYLLMMAITYLTYWMGIEGFRHLEMIDYRIPSDKKTSSYDHISNDAILEYKNQMEELMGVERLYLDERLELRDIADKISVEPNLISHVLNKHIGKNFYEYVNAFRVEEVRRKMADSCYAHLTILGIALESGFNSKTSFNRIFKQLTGMTPTEYQKS